VYSGRRLARVLRPALELQCAALAALDRGQPAPPLSNHTSAGLPVTHLAGFIDALAPSLPWKQPHGTHGLGGSGDDIDDDWFVSLQSEGASAVFAACDLLMQLQALEGGGGASGGARSLVAVGALSYHGPASSSFGGASSSFGQVRYPVPSLLSARDGGPGECPEAFEARACAAIDDWLGRHGDSVGVLLLEPQWGSSQCAMPWPPSVLLHLARGAKECGIKVCADEIMCGLGRHGLGGGVFASSSAVLGVAGLVDAVTFGKGLGGGAGDVLAGVAVRKGAAALGAAGRTALQSHTYSGASSRALLTATHVLQELPRTSSLVAAGAVAVGRNLRRLESESRGGWVCHGQGLLWGGVFAHRDQSVRAQAVIRLGEHCDRLGVDVYRVNRTGGFMVTPPLDAAEQPLTDDNGHGKGEDQGDRDGGALEEAMARLRRAAVEAADDMDREIGPRRDGLHMGIVH